MPKWVKLRTLNRSEFLITKIFLEIYKKVEQSSFAVCYDLQNSHFVNLLIKIRLNLSENQGCGRNNFPYLMDKAIFVLIFQICAHDGIL